MAETVFDAARALAFVEAHGDPSELARLRALVSGQAPPGEILDAVLTGQRADGGWAPFWAPGYSGLDATCFRLALAEQLGMRAEDERLAAHLAHLAHLAHVADPASGPAAGASRGAPQAAECVVRALGFIARRQQSDGTWQEAPPAEAAASVPPWLIAGDPAAILYLTANCGYWLAVLGGAAHADPAMAAADAIERDLGEDGRIPGFPHTHWLAAGLFHRVGRPLATDRVLARLRMTHLPDASAGSLAWLLTTLAAAGVPANHPTVRGAIQRLGRLQRPDGRWPSDDGPARDVHATLEALRALRWFGRARARAELAFV